MDKKEHIKRHIIENSELESLVNYCAYYDLIRALDTRKAKGLLYSSQVNFINSTKKDTDCMETATYYVGILIPTVVKKKTQLSKVEGIGVYVCDNHLQETIKLIAILYHSKHHVGLTQAYKAIEIYPINP